MESNAWDRAQDAIARATERDESVITPDNAVSPFDASSTMVIPQAAVFRRGPPTDPDTTQRLPPGLQQHAQALGQHRPPSPRAPGDGGSTGPGGPGRPSAGDGGNGFGPGSRGPRNGQAHGHGVGSPDGQDHPPQVRDTGIGPPARPAGGRALRSTHLPPEPPTRPVEVSDPRAAPARVAGPRPDTAPFAATDMPPPPPDDAPTRATPRRSWWRRLLGR